MDIETIRKQKAEFQAKRAQAEEALLESPQDYRIEQDVQYYANLEAQAFQHMLTKARTQAQNIGRMP